MSSIMEQLFESADKFIEETVDKDLGSEFDDKSTSSSSSNSSTTKIDECDGPSGGVKKMGIEGAEMNLSESEMLTADELFNIYSEAVVEVLRESKKAITKKYNEKKTIAKQFKAKKLAEKSKGAKKQKLEEAAMSGGFNSVMEQILDAR